MTTPVPANQYDIILIGGGLGTTAAARMLARAGKSVAMISGAGRSRSLEADGGLVAASLMDQAFGSGAPIGSVIESLQPFTATDVTAGPAYAPIEGMPVRRGFRRLELERWVRDQAIDAGAVWLEGFVEGHVLPAEGERLVLTEESGEGAIGAGTIVLCEGSDPRIAMRAGMRPDYSPEEQIHFARTILARPSPPVVRAGRTRTSWGMPIGVTVTPIGSVTLVTVDSRIENVMRGAKTTQEALLDLLASRLGHELALEGERIHSGIELSALRSHGKGLSLSQGNLLLGVDASGMLDMRGINRADMTIRSGILLGRYLAGPRAARWDDVAASQIREMQAREPRWHHSRRTGYVEEGAAPGAVKASASRLARGLVDRLRKG